MTASARRPSSAWRNASTGNGRSSRGRTSPAAMPCSRNRSTASSALVEKAPIITNATSASSAR